jgi:hydrogenase maturation protein HypF
VSDAGLHIEIRGTVQGVGFRPFVYRVAKEEGVRGFVRNDSTGVTIEVFGPPPVLESFCRRLRDSAPPAARVRDVRSQRIQPREAPGFIISPSANAKERRVSIPADLGTCDTCLHEIFDPSDRRYGYPFTNCTGCGPRFTIATNVPYDRSRTTMERFELCPDCRLEYEEPTDRRFHAEPNACPTCGPRLRLLDSRGREVVARSPLAGAARALEQGHVVAVKGLGGYHLAVDATSSAAVRGLRARKRREAKPFAVMLRDLDAVRAIARLCKTDAELLASPERPIVLVPRRDDAPSALCPEVAPGISLLGVLLPYTPLHHLLLHEVDRPLVMTSANLADEPILHRDDEALARLGGIADRFLVHDRPVATRCDDSVARSIAGRPTLLRRSRGYVPRPISLRRRLDRPVLACGAHLKNAFCLAVGDSAFLGPHIGDLGSVESYEALREAVERMQRLVGVEPELFACDLHPEYVSSRYARERAGKAAIGVQHHHAHVVSAMAEHGLRGPVLGLVWDGTGLGDDGSSWGGELLLADAGSYERLATFRPLALAGGDLAVREVWRSALALLCDAFDGDPPLHRIPLFAGISSEKIRVVRDMLERGVQTFPAHGVGRLFDAMGALVLGRPLSRYEGQVALEWNLVADAREKTAYPFELDDHEDGIRRIDWRPLVRAAVEDLGRSTPAAIVSARFHASLAMAAEQLLRLEEVHVGRHPIVLSGGCFQNSLLVERILERLAGDFEVHLHDAVPPGDGGLALGQAVVADAMASARGDA